MQKANLTDSVSATIQKHSLLDKNETVLVGLSGGPDSVCLLFLLHDIKERLSLTLHAVYVNHNLRPHETPEEIALCRGLCEKKGINFIVRSIDVKSYVKLHRMNRQEAARELRYKMFAETACEVRAQKIALAHNADDQAETLLIRIIRGAGPAGLSGIPIKRGNIIRPLLQTERSVIEDFLNDAGIGYITDSSNLKSDYFRNMVRLKLMPELRRFNPNLIQTINRTISILQEEERYLEILVTKTLMKLISRQSDNRVELFFAPLEAMDPVVLRRVLRRAIHATEGLRGIGFSHIEDIMKLIKEGRSGGRLYLPRGRRVIKDYSLLIITSEVPTRLDEYNLQPPGEIVLKGAGMVIKASFEDDTDDLGDGKSSVLLDAGNMTFPLHIRPRMPGDFFFPLGFGKRKKLQDFFVDEKVPRDARDSIPLVVSANDIVWIAGYRADARFRITGNTKKFLRLGIVKGRF